jgi:hypothetical protein
MMSRAERDAVSSLDLALLPAAVDYQGTVWLGDQRNRVAIGVGGRCTLRQVLKNGQIKKPADSIRLNEWLPIGNGQWLLCES